MPGNQLHIICVQPYGYIDYDGDRSSGALGSRSRIDKGLEIARSLERTGDIVFLFPQGFGKQHPRKPMGSALSLGASMKRYTDHMLSRGDHPHVRVVAQARSWGTRGDVEAILGMIADLDDGRLPHVHFVTDATHLKRVRLVWRHTGSSFPATFHASTAHEMTWKERWVREPIARLKYRWDFFREG